MLQTVSMDQLGRTEMSSHFGVFGQSLEITGFDKSLSVNHRTHPIRSFYSYWLLFSEIQYPYLPFNRVVPDSSSFALFSPASIVIENATVLTLDSFIINVTNTDLDRTLSIHEIVSLSPAVFTPHISKTDIFPGETASFTVFYCSTDFNVISASIFFLTDQGEIPYSISIATKASQKDFSVPNLHHLSFSSLVNLTIKVPAVALSAPRRYSVLYDTFLFEPGLGPQNRHLQLKPLPSYPYYLTFVSFVTQTAVRSVPLHILSSQGPLQPLTPVITTPVVTSPSAHVEVDIRIVNPTTFSFEVISLSKSQNPNIRWQLSSPPVVCTRASHTVVGKIIVDGTLEGSFESQIELVYTDGHKSFTLSIPVKSRIAYGALLPSSKSVDIVRGGGEVKFVNTFSEAVMVYGARVESNVFKVDNFKPFLVPPGSESKPIKILAEKPAPCSELVIETNVTNLELSVCRYSGQVTVSKDPSVTGGRNVLFILGGVLVGASQNFSVYITNPNPLTFSVNSTIVTPGVEIGAFWMRSSGGGLMNLKVPPFSTVRLDLFLTFSEISNNRPRNDTVTIIGDDAAVSVTVNWTPVIGKLDVSGMPSEMLLGDEVSESLYINSTFPRSVKLRSVSSTTPGIRVESLSPFLRTGAKTHVGKITVNSDVISRTVLHKLLSNPPLDYSKTRWLEKWNTSQKARFDIIFIFKGGYRMRKLCHLTVHVPPHNDLDVHFGNVSIGTYREVPIKIVNEQNYPIEYTITPVAELDFDVTKLTLEPGSTGTVNCILRSLQPGNVRIPVTVFTNGTAPFTVTAHASMSYPRLSILDARGLPITEVSVKDSQNTLFTRHPVTRTLFLRNDGYADITIDSVKIGNFETHPFAEVIGGEGTILQPNSIKEVMLKIYVSRMVGSGFRENITFEASGTEFSVIWSFELTEETRKALARARALPIAGMFVLIFTLPASDMLIAFLRIIGMSFRVRETREREVKLLTSNARRRVGVQCSFDRDDGSGGAFIRTEKFVPYATKGLDELKFLIDQM